MRQQKKMWKNGKNLLSRSANGGRRFNPQQLSRNPTENSVTSRWDCRGRTNKPLSNISFPNMRNFSVHEPNKYLKNTEKLSEHRVHDRVEKGSIMYRSVHLVGASEWVKKRERKLGKKLGMMYFHCCMNNWIRNTKKKREKKTRKKYGKRYKTSTEFTAMNK